LTISEFMADRTSAYIAGGMKPEAAAQNARKELLAIYKGEHYSRDASGAFRITPPPEALDIEAAMEKADAEALDMVIKTRPSQGVAERHKHSSELEGLWAFARKDWK